MTKEDRRKVLFKWRLPLTILIIFYTALTALRDFRDNFSREIWDSIGYAKNVEIFTVAEIPIAILVLLLLGLFGLVKQNYKAFIGFHYAIIGSCILIGLATWFFQQGILSAIYWMIAVGFGLYACYVPFNSIFFDRMIATFKIKGNAGYFIYLADSFGYLGSMGVLLYKNFGQSNLGWLTFFIYGVYGIATLGVLSSIASLLYFRGKYQKIKPDTTIQISTING